MIEELVFEYDPYQEVRLSFRDYYKINLKQRLRIVWEERIKGRITYTLYQYKGKTGLFEKISMDKLDMVYEDFCDKFRIPYKTQEANTAIKLVKARYHEKLSDLLKTKAYCCENGILDLHNKLIPHTPELFFLDKLPIQFGCVDDTPCYDDICARYPIQMKKFEWFVRATMFQNMDDQKSLFIVGPPNSGKSTLLRLLEAMFGDLESTQRFYNLSEKKLGSMVGKIINIDKDMKIGTLPYDAYSVWKYVVGKDGKLTIDIKYIEIHDHNFEPITFANGANQMPSLPQNCDTRAAYRRAIIIAFDEQIQDPDLTFMDRLLEERHAIFTKLYIEGYTPFYKEFGYTSVKDYEDEIMELWEFWTTPIYKIVEELFVDYITKPYECEEVYSMVEEELISRGFPLPKTQSLQDHVRKAMERLGYSKKNTSKKGVNIKKFFPIVDDNQKELDFE